jgi:hypothetical protein
MKSSKVKQEIFLPMVRRKTGNRALLIISSATALTLALLAGAVFFLLPKIAAFNVNQSTGTTGQVDNTTHTINAMGNTGKVSQVAVQPKQAAATTTKTKTNAKGSGNTTHTVPATSGNTNSAPATSTNNGNQATSAPATAAQQNLTVPVVTLKQYVPNIRHMVAQSFNITDKALALDLQNGMHLTNIAMQHGLSNAQLQTLLSSSISTGFQPAITTGSLTQAQVSTFIQQTQQNPTTLEQQLSILPPAVAHW